MSVRVLALDTAGPVVGVAAWVGDELVYAASQRIVQGADGWLGPALAAALDDAGGVDTVAVSVGPGAFTGLRVGVASALGLAIARGAQVVPLSSLAVRAAAVGEGEVLALLDARKGRVYAERFVVEGGVPRPLGAAQDVPPEVAFAGEPCAAVGEGAVVYAGIALARGFRLVEDADASALSAVLPLLRATPAVHPSEVTLAYLRPPDAVPPPGVAARG